MQTKKLPKLHKLVYFLNCQAPNSVFKDFQSSNFDFQFKKAFTQEHRNNWVNTAVDYTH